jgi:EmrB/QacA subfamily drug resistance transporter
MEETTDPTVREQRRGDRRRWLALVLVCFTQLMLVLDGTIVNVALPAIGSALRFPEAGLSWVVNGYLLTFGGFLLLGGRLGDIFGRRGVFMGGLALFTLSSLLCGLAPSQGALVAARALQGLGGAVIAPAALAIIVTSFPEPSERARAMGIWGFVASAGGSVGVFLGGLLTQSLGWPFIFLVNLPVGLAVLALCPVLLERGNASSRAAGRAGGFDLPGALLGTGAIVAAVYAVVGAETVGWVSGRTLLLLAGAAGLAAAFVAVERATARAGRTPLVPPGALVRSRNLAVSNAVMALFVVGLIGWFFFSALYLQRVLGYDPMMTGLAFLPGMVIAGVFSYDLAARIVGRFGVKPMMAFGMGAMAAGLFVFARAPVGGSYLTDVLPGMVLVGAGLSFVFLTVLLASVVGVPEGEAGLASGLINTSQQMGGALGLAVLASVAAARSGAAEGAAGSAAALNAGYHAAFLIGAASVLVALVLACALLHPPKGHGPR